MFSENVSGDFESALDQYAAKLKGGVARVGAQAMAQAVYDDAKRLAPVAEKPHRLNKYGKMSVPGTLRASIYQVYSRDAAYVNPGVQEYHVSWNRRKAPHGHLVEFGTSRAPAQPFLYPAYEMNKPKLIGIATTAMRDVLQGGATE